jgi:formate hydrogenlyase subunit 6/NADH:ubiquinone oxidoreductase subunit I
MLEILKKTLKAGCQTTKYPQVPDVAPQGFRGKPELHPDKCTYCGECAKVCPPGAIRISGKSDEKILTLSFCGCIFCGRCEEVCSFDAVKLTQEYELASKTNDDLTTSIRRKS